MNLDRALQLITALLAAVGALFLGLAHESVVLPAALALAAIVSVGVANRFAWLRLNRLVANLAALAAVCWSMRNFFTDVGTEEQLLAVADMLVYLQVVLLFQEKSGRVYWQLIVLSLLQVVVAAALNLGPHFGLLLAVYMITALTGLVVLCSYREWRKFGAPAGSPMATSAGWSRLLGEPRAQAPFASDAAAAGARAAAVGRQVALLALGTVVFATVYFYAVPRHHDGAWADQRGGHFANTGLTTQIALKEFGRIHLSNHMVMRVKLKSAATGQPYFLMSDPYFHGLALSDYVHDGSGGRWIAGRLLRTAKMLPESQPERSTPVTALVRQDYMLEGGAHHVHVILPMLPLQHKATDLAMTPISNRIVRVGNPEDQRTPREFQFSVATSSLRNGRQVRGIPHRNRNLIEGDQVRLKIEREMLVKFDTDRFPGLAATAKRAIAEAGVAQAGPLEQALALEQHFSESGLYQYSLTLNSPRDQKLDPIEDFVVNHRTGHCEYFASALVMMLRSRGIPARMVLGYRGGDFNTIGEYYQVRQKHAHAWVEALLDPGIAPEWELAGPPSGGGTWYRLDPTPSSDVATTASTEQGIAHRMVQTFDYIELLWRDYVLSLNARKQTDTIYEPMSDRTIAALPTWVDGRYVRGMLRRIARRLGIDGTPLGLNRGPAAKTFDWRSGMLLTALIVAAVIAVQGLIWIVNRQWSKRGGAGMTTRSRRPVAPPFYRRLESLLARLPVRRARGQTARELAAEAADRLNHGGPRAAAAGLPREIVEAYYRVRFGGAALDSQEQAAIEHALAELTPAVQQAQR